MATEFVLRDEILSSLLSILVTSLFIWIAARLVIDRASVLAALASAVISTLAAVLLVALIKNEAVALIAGIAVWALFTAFFHRTSWIKGAIIGLVAWVLFFLARLIL